MNSLDINPKRDRAQVTRVICDWLYQVAGKPHTSSRTTHWTGSLMDVRVGLHRVGQGSDLLPATDAATTSALNRARTEIRRRGFNLTLSNDGTVTIRSSGKAAREPRVVPAPLSAKDAARQVGSDKLKTHPKMYETAAKWRRS